MLKFSNAFFLLSFVWNCISEFNTSIVFNKLLLMFFLIICLRASHDCVNSGILYFFSLHRLVRSEWLPEKTWTQHINQRIPHIQNFNAKWSKLSIGSKLPTCWLNDSIEVSILKLRCCSIINHIIYFLSKAAVFMSTEQMCILSCARLLTLFSSTVLWGLSGSFVRKRSILGFLLNPFRTERLLPFRCCKLNEQF